MPAMQGVPNHVVNVKIKVIGPKCICLRVCPTTKEEISRRPFFNYSFQVEVYNIDANSVSEDFRKESSVFKEKFALLLDLSLSPTNLAPSMTLEVEDYGLKASINDLHNAGQQSGRTRP